jgi:hypothetical protein
MQMIKLAYLKIVLPHQTYLTTLLYGTWDACVSQPSQKNLVSMIESSKQSLDGTCKLDAQLDNSFILLKVIITKITLLSYMIEHQLKMFQCEYYESYK